MGDELERDDGYKDMSNEEINKAVAELCGWTPVDDSYGYPPTREGSSKWLGTDSLPDYTTSRDAAIEAVLEICRTPELKGRYMNSMEKSSTEMFDMTWDLIIATPLQICTALLKSVGKWKE